MEDRQNCSQINRLICKYEFTFVAFYFPQTRKTSIQFYHFTQKISTKFVCHIRINAQENKQQINEIIKYNFQLNTCSRFTLVKTEQIGRSTPTHGYGLRSVEKIKMYPKNTKNH